MTVTKIIDFDDFHSRLRYQIIIICNYQIITQYYNYTILVSISYTIIYKKKNRFQLKN